MAFKPDIDDLRESPAVHIALDLLAAGYDVVAVEPNIASHPQLPLVSADEALAEADVQALLVRHRGFLESPMRDRLSAANALDFCGILE